METVLRVFATAFLIVGVIGLVWEIPTRFIPSGASVVGGLLLFAAGELLSRRKQ